MIGITVPYISARGFPITIVQASSFLRVAYIWMKGAPYGQMKCAQFSHLITHHSVYSLWPSNVLQASAIQTQWVPLSPVSPVRSVWAWRACRLLVWNRTTLSANASMASIGMRAINVKSVAFVKWALALSYLVWKVRTHCVRNARQGRIPMKPTM